MVPEEEGELSLTFLLKVMPKLRPPRVLKEHVCLHLSTGQCRVAGSLWSIHWVRPLQQLLFPWVDAEWNLPKGEQ